ncbi:MAG: hypothetical protein NZ870_03245, partial [bacterium]|nr:hypothetical protein [bacterium]
NFIEIVFSTFLKIALTVFIATFFSMFTTSGMSTLVMSLLAYILGNLKGEMEFLYEKAVGLNKLILKILLVTLPSFNVLNYKDHEFNSQAMLYAFFYCLVYCFILYSLAFLIFKRKEF